MRNLKLIISSILLITFFASCKKDNTDDRDALVGTWTGIQRLSSSYLAPASSRDETLTITKGSGTKQIVLSQAGSTITLTGNVSGNKYTYDEYNSSTTYLGNPISVAFNGIGTVNGKTLTESGTVTYSVSGASYPSTWTTSLTKQ